MRDPDGSVNVPENVSVAPVFEAESFSVIVKSTEPPSAPSFSSANAFVPMSTLVEKRTLISVSIERWASPLATSMASIAGPAGSTTYWAI